MSVFLKHRHSKKAIIVVLLVSIAVIWDVIAQQGVLRTDDPVELARWIAQQRRSSTDCDKLIRTFPQYPPMSSQRSLCRLKVAEFQRDPAACKMLLPSKYGIYCIGNVLGVNLRENICYARLDGLECFTPQKLSYMPPDKSVSETEKRWKDSRPNLENCSSVKELLARDWCYTERSRQRVGVDDCEKVSARSQRQDDCFYAVALREKSIGSCDRILDPVIKSACRVRLSP